MLPHDHIWNAVFEQASMAEKVGEVPVGAVIVHKDVILTAAHNQNEATRQATAHAELIAIQTASQMLGTKTLSECDLYVSLEPCTMCAGAISHSRIRRLYFSAYDTKAGAVDNGVRFFHSPACHHAPEIYGGIRERESAALLKQFFAGKR